MLFKQQYSLFKQYNTYLHNIFLHIRISTTIEQRY